MAMKVLLVTNQVKRYNSGYAVVIEPLLELGHEVLWAANFDGYVGEENEIPCEHRQIDIRRNPFSLDSIRAFRQLCRLIKEQRFDAIYCSTPIGGLLARLAGALMGVDKIGYAAHGFTFYHGAPWWWNVIFKCEEFILARITDFLITINDEDMVAAQKFRLRGHGHVYQVGGAGIEEGYPCKVGRAEMRRELGIPDSAVVLVSAGALNKRKNYVPIIEALSMIRRQNCYYLICGEGPYLGRLKKLVGEKKLENNILFLGYRTDVLDIMRCADVFVLSSHREGLPRVTMEAMALGLPCVVSDIRGNRDLIIQGKNGYLCEPDGVEQYVEAITRLADDSALRDTMAQYNKNGVLYPYTTAVVYQQMRKIFSLEFGQ